MFIKKFFDRHLKVMAKTFQTHKVYTEFKDKKHYPSFRVKYEDDIKMCYVFDLLTGFDYSKLSSLSHTLTLVFNQPCTVEFETKLMAVYIYKQTLKQFKFEPSMLQKDYKCYLGLTNTFEVLTHDFEAIPHMLIGGSTGMGKTNLLKLIFYSIVEQNPHDVKFYFIDLKGGLEFARFQNMQQVGGIARDIVEATNMLAELNELMTARMDSMYAVGQTNLAHTKNKERIFIIIDEAASLTPDNTSQYKNELRLCQTYMSNIARIGRAPGLRLVVGTQYPLASALGAQLKACIDAKVGFRLQNETQSRVVLDEPGLEKLPITSGRGIYKTNETITFQCPYVSDEFLVKELKKHDKVDGVKEDETNRERDEDITFHS